ncbi:MAG: tRNA (adenosine(37)-N6)-threonylcarbamoyltransferase complex ATPase subunit type 1 TsaE [Lachnospiraceae bacterium]|nr:tRNA (adenosine(37)-N6)-threonylcarbamoyltransferase complex ATPase subunit type 1 TsaE [Lachnospiraceae bacterium]
MKTVETRSAKETYTLAEELGKKAEPGDIFALTGDLGTGKTVFAKGFAKGIGVTGHVSSPTFTIMQQYDDGKLPLYHFDVYRIGDISEMDETGYEECFYGDGVTLVEWADLISDIMPDNTVWIKIEKDNMDDYDHRRITIENENTGD